MISLKSEFRFLDRGFKDTLVLIPGWATDYRIFNSLDLDYNYLLTTKLYPFNFNSALLDKIDKQRLCEISIFGFSLGGFLACGFAAKYPQTISELILVGIRRNYQPKALVQIREHLSKNRRAWLYKLYKSCFSGLDKQGLSWFKKNLLEEYIAKIGPEELIWGLDYLASHRIEPRALADIEKIRIFHGSDDAVAPLEEALEIKSKLPQAEFIHLSGLGHISFLNPVFKERFYHG